MKIITAPFLGLILLWQKLIAPMMAPRCKYYPSCSQYTFDAIKGYGLIGIIMGAWRVLRCNPWSHGGVDYVPEIMNLNLLNHSIQVKKQRNSMALKGVK